VPVRHTFAQAFIPPTAREAAHLAYHDPLTGLPNRAQLTERLTDELRTAAADGGALALLYVDLNDFKLVNDSLGHGAGDELLRRVGARLRGAVRARDVVARQGGDEFMLLLTGLRATDVQIVAERVAAEVSAALDDSFSIDDAVFQIGASVGIAFYPGAAHDAEALHRQADSAVYAAKEAGGGYAVYEPSVGDPLARLSLAARMRHALDAGEFELHYQPVYTLAPEPGIRGVEALIRWNDPERGMVSPADFIPVAESTGVIDALGDWVVRAMLDQAAEWRDAGLMPKVGFNVSPRQLRHPAFVERLVNGVHARELDPKQIVVELTESAWMLDGHRALPVLRAIRDAGIPLALDDFGAGYSSLGRLRKLPVGIIKIDRAFMDGVPDDPQACTIVAAILQLAAACDCDVVAEGIETQGQLEFLTARGCLMGQGFHLARPMPVAKVTPLLAAGMIAERRA
jgi:diguanylate cyclase (GGDEF)-like protein